MIYYVEYFDNIDDWDYNCFGSEEQLMDFLCSPYNYKLSKIMKVVDMPLGEQDEMYVKIKEYNKSIKLLRQNGEEFNGKPYKYYITFWRKGNPLWDVMPDEEFVLQLLQKQCDGVESGKTDSHFYVGKIIDLTEKEEKDIKTKVSIQN
jgi:hypothetical protein